MADAPPTLDAKTVQQKFHKAAQNLANIKQSAKDAAAQAFAPAPPTQTGVGKK